MRRLGKKGNRYYSTLEETPCECCERLVIECFAVLGSSSRDATCGPSMEDTRSSKPSGGIPHHVLDCSRADVSRSRFEHMKASAPGSLLTHSLDSLNTTCNPQSNLSTFSVFNGCLRQRLLTGNRTMCLLIVQGFYTVWRVGT